MSEISVDYRHSRACSFERWLRDIQNNIISDEDFEKIKNELQGTKNITSFAVYKVMKSLGIDTDMVGYVMARFKGHKVIIIEPDLERSILGMFEQVNEVWSRLQVVRGRSFFAFSYILNKFLQLLGEENKYPSLSREKQQMYDVYWMQVCHELNWEYIPSFL